MAKSKKKVRYNCAQCGYQTANWMGNCPSCGEWNTFKEEKVQQDRPAHKSRLEQAEKPSGPTPLKDVAFQEKDRQDSGISELNRVLGGGFMPGSFVLLGGDPGIGKSTIALQIAMSRPDLKMLYCSGEESAEQIRQRSTRMGFDNSELLLFTETDVNQIADQATKEKPDLLVIDSIQTVYRPEIQSMPGTVNQIRECASLLMQLAKQNGITILAIGHVTKQGDLAGPRVLEHMVDTTINFEGDLNLNYRILRAVKNRFGPANEIGVFEMKSDGLHEVRQPSGLFLNFSNPNVSGSSIICTMEGTRPLMIEVQALVTTAHYGTPQRTASGVDQRRLALLLAVLEKRTGWSFAGMDVFVNIAGGLKLNETAADLGMCCALVSSLSNRPVSAQTVIVGEVGLGGEVRPVSALEKRVEEAVKMGFEQILIPAGTQQKSKKSGQSEEISSLQQALQLTGLE